MLCISVILFALFLGNSDGNDGRGGDDPTRAYTCHPCDDGSGKGTIESEPVDYTMAFILVENSENPASTEDIRKTNILKYTASETFSWATYDLASLDTSAEVYILQMNEAYSYRDVAIAFYASEPDNFDFLTIYATHDHPYYNYQFHLSAQNKIKGIGKSIFDNSENFGSAGRLLGINWLKNIDQYNPDDEIDLKLAVNGILHETSHQWGAFIDFIDENGSVSNTLRNPYNMAHWDKKLDTDYDLLNGFSWTDNGDGTFTADTKEDLRKGYCELDLYLMGLISRCEVSPLTLIVTDTDTAGIQPGTTVQGYSKTITIDQIIAAEGERVWISP
jgi:hypothetical protein